MSDNINSLTPLTVAVLLEELREVDNWYMLGAYLNVPVYQLNKFQSTHGHTHDGVERCKLEVLQYWLNTTMTASWKDVARTLEQLNMLKLAAIVKSKYLWAQESSVQPLSPQSGDSDLSTDPCTDPLVADVKVVGEIQDLESNFSHMYSEVRDVLANCDVAKAKFFLNDLFDTDEFKDCCTIDELLQQLRRNHVDTFNVYYLRQLVSLFHHNADIVKSINKYEEKQEKFLKTTTVKDFQHAVVSKAQTDPPKGMAAVSIRVPNVHEGNKRTLKDIKTLARKAFKGQDKNLGKINVTPGSIVITWYVPESLCNEFSRLARENMAVLREQGVEKVSIVGKNIVTLSTQDGHEVNIPGSIEQQELMFTKLNSKLKNTEQNLQTVNKLLNTQEAELIENRNRLVELETFCESQFPISPSQVLVAGEGIKIATAGQEGTFQLKTSKTTPASLPFLIKQLSCQLTDPRHQRVPCSITSTQPGVCTVTYTPTIRGPHQLRIAIRNTELMGSPFTIHVQPSLEMRGVIQHTITPVEGPYGVAVSTSGDIVVSKVVDADRISVYSREGEKLRSFGPKGSKIGLEDLWGVAVTFDNHVLVADGGKHRIRMFNLEGRFITSVGQQGNGPFQFNHPSGIAVHPSGRVFVADTCNHRIQVLHHDLTYSHMFGSRGSAPGQFSYLEDVACDNSGIVYVTDCGNHRVQLFTADGQFISLFGSEGSQHGQLYRPRGICVDSTNTVYVTDLNHRVSVYTSSGQFIKTFSTKGSGEGKLNNPRGVAVDNTTGALYVCDNCNNRVVAY